MTDIAVSALHHAESMPDVTYCDARAETRFKISAHTENGKTEHITSAWDAGIGIRMLTTRDAWVFVSVSSPESAGEVADAMSGLPQKSENVARTSMRAKNSRPHRTRFGLGHAHAQNSKVHTAKITHRAKEPPDQNQIARIGAECSRAMYDAPKIVCATSSPQSESVSKYYTDSTGCSILQEYTDTVMSITATSNGGHGHATTRTIDATVGGRGGLEAINDSHASKKAVDITAAVPHVARATTAKYDRDADVVMNPNFVALLAHEILGHPSEADRVIGHEMAWAGGAWWSGMLGKKIGSHTLNAFDDPTIPDTLGSYAFDDEGVASSKTTLVKNGILQGHMHSKETAHVFGTAPTGNMRATDYRFMPLVRMACTCIGPGDHTQEEMIRDVRDGYFIYDMKIPSIDMNRYNWSISCQYAQRIKDGVMGEVLRDVIVSGTAPKLFESISQCGKDFAISAITNCGKGDPMQALAMGNGGPSIRAKATVSSVGGNVSGGNGNDYKSHNNHHHHNNNNHFNYQNPAGAP